MDWDPNSTDTGGYICPPCPVFRPSLQEFQDPLKYISSIRHIGAQSGIVKIVPPAGWRPPFAINEKTFRFRIRVQQLNCIDGLSRAEGHFVDALRMFLYRSGTPMKELPRVDGQLLNLHLLFKTVVEAGGYEAVCAQQQWAQIVRRVGRTRASGEPTPALCDAYQQHYETCLLSYERQEAQKKEAKVAAAAATVLNSPSTKKIADTGAVETPATGSTSATTATTTPTAKSAASSRKKQQAWRTQTAPKEDDEDSDSPESKRVKRTLMFSGGGHSSSSEENDVKQEETLLPRARGRGAEKQEHHEISADLLEPMALRPLEDRKCRLDVPEIHVGQKFYQFFPESGAILAEIKRVHGGKKPHAIVKYIEDGSCTSVDLTTVQIIVANGWDPDAAELAFKSEICQSCLRGDCWEQMLLCDGCNSGHHLFCLSTPLSEVPPGDWYCDQCVEESCGAASEQSPTFGFEMGSEYTLTAYKEKADAWKRNYFGLDTDQDTEQLTDLELETEYWRLLGIPVHEQRLEVEYGSDVDSGSAGSGFPRLDTYLKGLRCVTKRWKNLSADEVKQEKKQMMEVFSHGLREAKRAGVSLEKLLEKYAHEDWNLNNLPKLAGSVLQHLDEDIKGVMIPWIYMGMCFSTFCWHVEDHNFYSISYNHCGAAKTWYGVPGHKADHLEATMKKLAPELFGSQPDLHLQLVTMFSPATLIQHGVPVYRATHNPNEFVVTFPSAYHSGFNNGFNCAEAVNFATVDWLPWGAKSVQNYRKFSKLPVFSHEALVCSLSETMVEQQTFDAQSAETYLLPAMQQLVKEYIAFERRVSEESMSGRERIEDFAKRLQGIVDGDHGDAPSSSMRTCKRNVAQAANNGAVTGAKHSRTSKMSMSESMKSARPTRMVIWAGQSGKHGGLRCTTCKQYCYLQAVVCTKCRHTSKVGCIDHYPTMCGCNQAKHYLYLYRYDSAHLKSILQSMQKRLAEVREWGKAFDIYFGVKREDEVWNGAKPTADMLKKLFECGIKIGGVDQQKLDTVDDAVIQATRWTTAAEHLLQSDNSDTGAVLNLLAESEKLVAEPNMLQDITNLAKRWNEYLSIGETICADVATTEREEGSKFSSFNFQEQHHIDALWHENTRHEATIISIMELIAGLESTRITNAGPVIARLERANHYLEALSAVNNTISTIWSRLKILEKGSSTADPRDAAAQLVVYEHDCRIVVENAEKLVSDPQNPMLKVEVIHNFLKVTELESAELESVLHDSCKSTEEMEALVKRLQDLVVRPSLFNELVSRLDLCRAWERKAREMLESTRSTHTSPSSSLGANSTHDLLMNRSLLNQIEKFYDEADAHFVSSSSLLRRQIHTKIQDCRRWYAAVHSLFVKPPSQESLSAFLKNALNKFSTYHARVIHPHSRLSCVCEQVLLDRVNTVDCYRCKAKHHLKCVPSHRPGTHFLCAKCKPANVRPSITKVDTAPMFCVCRGAEDMSMICCDFCDEWYHSRCIGMTDESMNSIEAYRCQRCAIKQNLYYLDRKTLRKDYLGKRPAMARVDALVAHLHTLMALPPGAVELLEYVDRVKQVSACVEKYVHDFAMEFSPANFARLDYHVEERKILNLMKQLTDLEISLDTVQGGLGAVHWCLRACHMVLGCASAPAYAHLVVLLADTKQPNFVFPRVEFSHIQATIEDRVQKAARWLKQVKSLEVEEWNIERARRLLREHRELDQFLTLPATEVAFVRRTAGEAATPQP